MPDSSKSAVTTHPVFAVMGVLLGALTSVFAGRLLSIGSADIQGALGLSADSMSWVNTAYNAATMFIGPLTVFMGNLLGVRRILLPAGCIFMLAEFVSPFVGHNAAALVIAQTIAGLAAGTFYPLTFTMIIRNFAMKYLYLGVALYGLDIVASTHFGHFIEAYYMTNLSWHWLFWNALITTPFMLAGVYMGIPRQGLPQIQKGLTFWGFLYAACSLTLIYIALDQGERLDWFNSPIISALTASGLFMMVVTIVSRNLKPNPMLNLSFLLSRNFLILGGVLIGFRFTILESTLLVPNFLSTFHGYRPEQTGAVLSWTSLSDMFFSPLAGLAMYKIDSRLVCALGFFFIAASCVWTSQLDPSWTGENFYAAQVVFASGLALALVGLVATLLHSALAAGALKVPVNLLTISCWFQTCRLFGAEGGKSLLAHFLKVQGDLHYNVLAAHINGDWLTTERLTQLAAVTMPADRSLATSAISLSKDLKQQVTLLSLGDGFILIALVSVITIIAIGLLRYSPSLPTE